MTPDAHAPGAPGAGPLARAAELELRLREEVLRRERAESRAASAEALAEVAAARTALLEARAAQEAERRAEQDCGRDEVAATIRAGLRALRDELDALRPLAEAAARDARAADARSADRPSAGDPSVGSGGGARASFDSASPGSDAPRPTRPATDPSVRMGELARGARELLAGGRLDAADEVIRGLEDAAERLRAQAPPPDAD
ncbi:hypothetical protein [Patulibacter americanus]|uniref:hypothetical protein n=1 Tax=Patulibacter americanus TaxID=588672 RepID=UPI0003B5C228|nr:hypothetical protein [Patulibacter americanus]